MLGFPISFEDHTPELSSNVVGVEIHNVLNFGSD
jgi:hypothetical protein